MLAYDAEVSDARPATKKLCPSMSDFTIDWRGSSRRSAEEQVECQLVRPLLVLADDEPVGRLHPRARPWQDLVGAHDRDHLRVQRWTMIQNRLEVKVAGLPIHLPELSGAPQRSRVIGRHRASGATTMIDIRCPLSNHYTSVERTTNTYH